MSNHQFILAFQFILIIIKKRVLKIQNKEFILDTFL